MKKGQISYFISIIIALLAVVMILVVFYTTNKTFHNTSKTITHTIEDYELKKSILKEKARQFYYDCIDAQNIKECFQDKTKNDFDKHYIEGLGSFYMKIKDGYFEISKNSLKIKNISLRNENEFIKINGFFDISINTSRQARRVLGKN